MLQAALNVFSLIFSMAFLTKLVSTTIKMIAQLYLPFFFRNEVLGLKSGPSWCKSCSIKEGKKERKNLLEKLLTIFQNLSPTVEREEEKIRWRKKS